MLLLVATDDVPQPPKAEPCRHCPVGRGTPTLPADRS